MWRHLHRVLEANRHTNLTRITAPVEAAVKHYADSLALIPWARRMLGPDTGVLDVGTGAGFPAVPLAICCPTWQVLAVDGTRKKSEFVSLAASELGLTNLIAQHVRARELAGRVIPFDLVTCRAVGDPVSNAKECRRLLTAGGWLVCYATPRTLDALTEARRRQIERLGYGGTDRYDYHLSLGGKRLARTLAIWRRL